MAMVKVFVFQEDQMNFQRHEKELVQAMCQRASPRARKGLGKLSKNFGSQNKKIVMES